MSSRHPPPQVLGSKTPRTFSGGQTYANEGGTTKRLSITGTQVPSAARKGNAPAATKAPGPSSSKPDTSVVAMDVGKENTAPPDGRALKACDDASRTPASAGKTPVMRRTPSDRSCDSARRLDARGDVGDDAAARRAEEKTPEAYQTPFTQRGDSARRFDAPGDVGDDAAACRAEEKTTRTRDLDSAKATHRDKVLLERLAARENAPTEIDGSQLLEYFEKLEEMKDAEDLKKAYAAWWKHNVDGLKDSGLPISKIQLDSFFNTDCQGIFAMHYPPSKQSGAKTNLCLNVNNKASIKEGRIIYKIKSSCIRLQAYAIAHCDLKPEEKYECQEIHVRDGDGEERTFNVENRAAVALRYDHLEMFPTCDANDAKFREVMTEKYGKAWADAYMKKAGRLFAELVRARQEQVRRTTGVRPQVFLWNVSKTAEGKQLGGSQIDTWNALQSAGDAGDVSSSYHPSYLVMGNTNAKSAAKFADDNVWAFVQRSRPALAAVTPVAPAGATAASHASGPASAADADGVRATPSASAPSTALAAPRPAGFWECILGVASLTEAEREEFRLQRFEEMATLREILASYHADVKLFENKKAKGEEVSDEETKAYEHAPPSVQGQRNGGANGRKTAANYRADVKLFESKKAKGEEVSDEDLKAYETALPIVQRERDGAANGGKAAAAKAANYRADVKLFESKKAKGEEVSDEQKKAYELALPSVQRLRDGAANGAKTMAAKAAAKAPERAAAKAKKAERAPERAAAKAKKAEKRLKDFEFGPTELAELAVALRAYVNAKRDTSQPMTSWSNLVARKWPREYALSKQATGVKCTAQKVMAAIDENLLDRYQETWEWKGGWPAEARAYPPCKISIQHGA